MENNYFGEFTSWADINSRFEIDEVEPDNVLYACYDIDGYEGSASVIFRRGRKYYYNQGSHCSCYGLENQWEPEEFSSKSKFVDYLKKTKYITTMSSIEVQDLIRKLEK
jgi:hypothetical protein